MASFTNMATLSYNGSQINSNVVTGELRDALTITKTAVSGGYRPGDTVTYVVTLSNTGTAALTGLTLSDDLGGSTAAAGTVYPLAYVPGSVLYYNGGTVQPAPTVTAGPPMTVTGVTVPAGGLSVAIQFTQNFLGVQPKCSQICKFVKDFRPDLLGVCTAGIEVPCKLVEVSAHLAALGKQSGKSGQGFFAATCNDDRFLDLDVVDGAADKSGEGEIQEFASEFQ